MCFYQERVTDLEKKITLIQVQQNNKERVNVFLDGDFAFACHAEMIYKFGLKKDSLVNDEYLKEINEENNFLTAKYKAIKYVERSLKTEREVKDSLIRAGYEEHIIERVIEFLKKQDFINDEKYVKAFISSNKRNNGRNKLKFALIRKGVSEKVIEIALNCIDEEELQDTALELAKKRYKILLKSEGDKVKLYRKLTDYMVRRGYTWEQVKTIVDSLVNE